MRPDFCAGRVAAMPGDESAEDDGATITLLGGGDRYRA